MGKRSKAARRAARAAIAETELRASNGRARVEDIGFLDRMRRMADGKDGYSGDYLPLSQFPSYPQVGGPQVGGGGSGYDWHRGVGTPKGGFKSSPFKSSPREDGVFCVESGEVEGACPLKPVVPSILIDARMWEVFLACTREYDTEWIALLIGSLGADSKGVPAYIIERFYFPAQTATGTHVDVPVEVRPKAGTIGAIHSHVNMGVFFSGTDKAHSNWPVEIVINRKREYEAVARYQLKCGEWAKTKTSVYLTGSFISARVKELLDGAFKSGDVIEKGRRKGSTSTAIVPAPAPTQATLFQSKDTTYNQRIENPSKFPPMPSDGPTDGWDKPCATPDCGHSYYLHYWNSGTGTVHGCATTKCGCMKFTPGPEPTPTVTAPIPDDGSAIFPLSPSELNPDPYACVLCEGDGWVEVEVGGIKEVIECSTCGGSGLNQQGLSLQAEVGHQLI